MDTNSEVIFKGEKFFAKYHKKIEILMVNHEEFSCIEMIVIGVKKEALDTRLYLKSAVLVTMLNIEHFNCTLAIKLKSAKRLKVPFDPGFEMKKAALNTIVTMLVKGLDIIPSVFASEFDLCFEINGHHYLEGNIAFEFAVKPLNLVPFLVSRQKVLKLMSVFLFVCSLLLILTLFHQNFCEFTQFC